jgi:hypothetical protein
MEKTPNRPSITPMTNDGLRERVLVWIWMNPGVDDEDVSKHFGISGLLAGDIVDELMNEGRLVFADYVAPR